MYKNYFTLNGNFIHKLQFGDKINPQWENSPVCSKINLGRNVIIEF